MTDLRAIARALGGEILGGQIVAPGPGHTAKDRSLGVRPSSSSPDGFLAFSYAGDDWRDCREYVRGRLGISPDAWKRDTRRIVPPRRPQSDDEAGRLKRALASANRIGSEIVPLVGTPGEAYLRDVRNLDTPAIRDVLSRTGAIGWHSAVLFNQRYHPLHQRKLGCIVGIMSDAKTAEPTGAISRTYIATDGTKVGKAKTLGSPTGIVRLSADDEVLEGLCLAEGLETALVGMSIGLRPMWATGSSGTLAAFPVLSGVEALSVIVDHDVHGAGEKAARAVEARWLADGREVNLFRSDAPGDLNDALRGFA